MTSVCHGKAAFICASNSGNHLHATIWLGNLLDYSPDNNAMLTVCNDPQKLLLPSLTKASEYAMVSSTNNTGYGQT